MTARRMNLRDLNIDQNWTLFLDRDGVINEKIEGGYVTDWNAFKFIPGVEDAIKTISAKFGKLLIVTNQQGIGKKIYTAETLQRIHNEMLRRIIAAGGRIDKIYFAPHLHSENHPDRKPGTGMAMKAREDFHDINFAKSLVAGDSKSDMEFGRAAGMKTIQIGNAFDSPSLVDFRYNDLTEMARAL
jgi:D-glycero-D-manno-heptose 1,7-bisphosphate phosphatase